MIKWEWGFYARLLNTDGSPVNDVKYSLRSENKKSDFNIVSTIFFKKFDDELKQRIDVEINSLKPELTSGTLKIYYDK